jgi:hypothetical protein
MDRTKGQAGRLLSRVSAEKNEWARDKHTTVLSLRQMLSKRKSLGRGSWRGRGYQRQLYGLRYVQRRGGGREVMRMVMGSSDGSTRRPEVIGR